MQDAASTYDTGHSRNQTCHGRMQEQHRDMACWHYTHMLEATTSTLTVLRALQQLCAEAFMLRLCRTVR
jgi:hypothetical protein